MRPDWREIARRQEAELGKRRDEEADCKTVAELRRRLDAAQLVDDEAASLGGDGPDYLVTSRKIHATKGKWRIVSKEVEEAEGKN